MSGNNIGGSIIGNNSNSFDPNSNNNDDNNNTININTGPTPNPNPSPDGPTAAIPVPDISTGVWIWTPEAPIISPPVGPRGFRKTMDISGKVDSLIIDITCDNFESVYVNGSVLGFTLDFTTAKRWSITFPPTDKVVIAIFATNDPDTTSYAGVIAAAVAWDSTDPQGEKFRTQTDGTWKCTTSPPPDGFLQPDFDDGSWVNARVVTSYAGYWHILNLPTHTSPITEGYTSADAHNTQAAPSAPLAKPGPDVDGSVDV